MSDELTERYLAAGRATGRLSRNEKLAVNPYHPYPPSCFANCGVGVQIFEWISILKAHMISLGDGVRIDPFSRLEGGQGIVLGKGVHVSAHAHLNIGGGHLVVGDYVALTSGVKIHTGSNTAAGQSMSSASPEHMQVIERGAVTIGDYAFIGSGAQILMGVTVGEYAVVGAGAVVTKDVPAYTVWMGVPAKMVGRRVRLADGAFGIDYFAKADELAEMMEASYP